MPYIPKAAHAEFRERSDEPIHLTLNIEEAYSILSIVQGFCKAGVVEKPAEHIQYFNLNLLTKLEDAVCTTPAITELVRRSWPERIRNEHNHRQHARKKRQRQS
jgi:hypothetical protein